MGSPRVSVLVAAGGTSAELLECLELVRAQACEVEAEIVLVLNTDEETLPDDQSRAFEQLGTRLAFEPNIGKSHALNLGVRVCRGEVIAFTDDDALPRPGWLRTITAPLLDENRPEKLIGCGGRVTPLYPARGVPDWFVHVVDSRTTSFLGPRHNLGLERRDYGTGLENSSSPIGANCAYRSEVFRNHGFDPTLGPNRSTGMRGGEDVALGQRLLAEGYRLQYLPHAEVFHPVRPERATFEFARRAHLAQGVERVRVARSLGRNVIPASRLRRRLRRDRLRRTALFLLPRARRIRRRLREALLRGMLAELEGRSDQVLFPGG